MIPTETFVLGAPDPEMELIERLLREAGMRVIYALGPDGARVRPADAYRVAALSEPLPAGATVYRVECDGPVIPTDAKAIDHHLPGDPGYGQPPTEFLPASSLGQVIAELARLGQLPAWPDAAWPYRRYGRPRVGVHAVQWSVGSTPRYVVCVAGSATHEVYVGQRLSDDERSTRDVYTRVPVVSRICAIPEEYLLAAAADHCLGAAYRGECPGVDPDALMRWRVESRARFQRRPVEDVLADVERAREALRNAPLIDLDDGFSCDRHYPATPGRNAAWNAEYCDPQSPCRLPVTARDMRGRHVPELPEASAREGVCFIADGLPGPDGRIKVVCQSGSPEQIAAFMRAWAPAQGLVDIYGDPERGFAGGYVKRG